MAFRSRSSSLNDLTTLIFCDFKSNSLEPLIYSAYPKSKHETLFASVCVRLVLSSCA
ncbi:hypothetical protein Plhal304r1_c033g0104921 [Plasmopara halstedii]